MSAAFGLLFVCAALPDRETAVASTNAGRFPEALLAAEAEVDPARRAEGLLYVRHHAGDLEGALRVAADARGAGVGSAWLAEREVYVALSIRDAVRARAALDALAARPDGGKSALEAAGYGPELEQLERTLRERDRAIVRAKATVVAIAIAGLLGFAWLARRSGAGSPGVRAAPSRA